MRQIAEGNTRSLIIALLTAIGFMGSAIIWLVVTLLKTKDEHLTATSVMQEKHKGEILGLQRSFGERIDEIQNARVEEVQAVTQAALVLERATLAAENRRGGK